MNRVRTIESVLTMRFKEIYQQFLNKEMSSEDAGYALSMSSRSFLRKRRRYEEEGFDGLFDRRLGRRSGRRAPDNEVKDLCDLFRDEYRDYNVRHFHSVYRRQYGHKRSYTWVNQTLKSASLVRSTTRGGKHRKRRPRRPKEGMMLHQDGSKHRWIEALDYDIDLIITLDDATSKITSAFFVLEEGTGSSLRGIEETIQRYGLFCSFYTDRGSHYFHTPKAGGKVSKYQLTHVGKVLKKLGIQHIESYSPQGRGRCERMFGTLQGRLPQELKKEGIKTMEDANRYLWSVYIPAHNGEFSVSPESPISAYIPWLGDLRGIMAYEEERTVHNDNTVQYKGMTLQLCATQHRHHYVKTRVIVKEFQDGAMEIWHGPHPIATYNRLGERLYPSTEKTQKATKTAVC